MRFNKLSSLIVLVIASGLSTVVCAGEVKDKKPISVGLMDQFSVEFERPVLSDKQHSAEEGSGNKVASASINTKDLEKDEKTSNQELKEQSKQQTAKVDEKLEEKVEAKEAVVEAKVEEVVVIAKEAKEEVKDIQTKVEEKVESVETVVPVVKAETNQVVEQKTQEVSETVKEFVVTDEMLNTPEVASLYPLPPKPNVEIKETVKIDTKSYANTYFVEPGIGMNRIVRDLLTDDLKAKGITRKMLILSIYRMNKYSFSKFVPIFPYENAELKVPTEQLMLLETDSSYDEFFSMEGEDIRSKQLPKLGTNLLTKEELDKYEATMNKYNQDVEDVMNKRREYLIKQNTNGSK